MQNYIRIYPQKNRTSSQKDGKAISNYIPNGSQTVRTGQVLNISSLANDAGVSVNTAKSWLSLLEASYIIFLLPPYYQNFNKRIIKSPKIYFYDTGLACSLLRIGDIRQLTNHYLIGSLFENLVIAEIIKQYYHSGKRAQVYYWRESNGIEIDCIIENSKGTLTAIEIKSGETISADYFRNLKKFPAHESDKIVIYGGNEILMQSDYSILPFIKLEDGIEKLLDA